MRALRRAGPQSLVVVFSSGSSSLTSSPSSAAGALCLQGVNQGLSEGLALEWVLRRAFGSSTLFVMPDVLRRITE